MAAYEFPPALTTTTGIRSKGIFRIVYSPLSVICRQMAAAPSISIAMTKAGMTGPLARISAALASTRRMPSASSTCCSLANSAPASLRPSRSSRSRTKMTGRSMPSATQRSWACSAGSRCRWSKSRRCSPGSMRISFDQPSEVTSELALVGPYARSKTRPVPSH